MEKTSTRNSKQSKFFPPYPEIDYVNQLQSNSKKTYLLQNGNLCTDVRGIPGGHISVRNTCGFDSIAHILFTSAIDNSTYESFINKSSVPFLLFIKNFMQNGPKVPIYKERATILLPFYMNAIKINTVFDNRVLLRTMDATDAVSNVWEHMMESEPSAYRTMHCQKCGESSNALKTLWVKDHGLIVKNGFGVLETALGFSPVVHDRPCWARGCNGRATHTTETNVHIFIEIDIRETVNSPPQKTKLQDIATKLKLGTRNYRFALLY